MAMDDLVLLEDKDLDGFLEVIAYIAERRNRTGAVRVCVDDGTLKLKVDRGTWSPPFGRQDPECEAARAAAVLYPIEPKRFNHGPGGASCHA